MPPFDPTAFATILAVLGVVIVLATLASGLIDRQALPAVGIFLLLGLALGPTGLGLLDVGLRSVALGVIATISLTLVLFTDAVAIDRVGLKGYTGLAALVLGPGTLLSATITGVAAWALLDLPPALAAILGAALASTDPVMMRGLLRRPGIPVPARIVLSFESGLNDVIVLPIILVAIAMLQAGGISWGATGRVAAGVLVVGPLIGAVVGWLAVRALEWVRARAGLRRDYESLFVLGVAFAAFAAAEMLHASGFMAAFSAGLVVAILDVQLCDCFHDYGAATAEMFLLFSFVALGTSLIWQGLTVVSPAALGFAAIALFGRTAVMWLALLLVPVDRASRRYLIWFGPRALSSLLLVLLPTIAGVTGAEGLFPVVALVVLLSVAIHGAMVMVWNRDLGPREAIRDTEVLTIAEYRALVGAREPVKMVDVRTTMAWNDSDLMAAGAVRIDPDRPVESAASLALPKNDWLIAYCT
jgi:NhaP-type Na+/H+ or K+/H+ antiporter